MFKHEVHINERVVRPLAQVTKPRDAKGLAGKRRPESIEVAQYETVAINKEGFIVGTVLIEVELLPNAGTEFGSMRDDGQAKRDRSCGSLESVTTVRGR